MLVLKIDFGEYVTMTTDKPIPAGATICTLHCGANVDSIRVGIEAERFVQIARSDAKRKEQLTERQAGGSDKCQP